ncbi:non-hydrolyzing UDP-N-acetylglucosamine 2-epimerase [Sphaerospermopsis sp. LEGE 08334]|jgi:UDP-GlcNAc3NAcA epimerase|uniref:non-hydrolyzing UDP-N-acetylglucosamine 2-epimerase n=1 Tax=Sphaerospermopsis sp. LEGE 08334 TaxID=1828651 RepID=UPI001882CB96|nr:UDP-N-acetylglucosamine 2-epimerase (non-hydrolyzing) [Sphaerospermopsis sp. LEGE 08334]MBE9059132.1 UDP-N-acetylglucosamine 2-epimerase (non-hydrolyzing) [Sphaerospermopsis sp. LEGE 08334]
MKILTIVGARPQFIKAATVSRAIEEYSDSHIQEILVHTGQHYDVNMSDVFFTEMQIPSPQYHLGIGGGSHGAMTGHMLSKIEQVLLKETPDVVLVYGDTNSTLAGALAAAKLHIPVAHVEAGLRSFNRQMPEEINRVLTDHLSDWLFCPTHTAIANLAQEGIVDSSSTRVCHVGDVMYDAALFYRNIAQASDATNQLISELKSQFYLATIHRAENTDNPDRLDDILQALNLISQTTPVVLPLHPRTRKILEQTQFHHIRFLEPVGYFDMITFLSHCQGVFTDSGGVQKEAYFFRKPCVTLREETEWVELVKCGVNVLTGASFEKIIDTEKHIHNSEFDYSQELYGSGNSSYKIVEILSQKM